MKALLKAVALVSVVSLLTACNPLPGTPASDWQYIPDQAVRAELFQKCLSALPAGPVSTHYNDWSEVVDSCESSALLQSQKLAKADAAGRWFYQDGTPVK